MRKLFQYLRPFWLSVIFIIAFLAIQANVELALPDYMSKIVNIGISRQGVEFALPEAIRPVTLEQAQLFMSPAQWEEISQVYQRDPEGIYRLQENLTSEQKEHLASLLHKPLGILKGAEQLKERQGQSAQAPMDISLLQKLPASKRQAVLESIDQEFDKLPAIATENLSIQAVQDEYAAIGLDTVKMQNDYIWKSGLQMLALAFLSLLCIIAVSFLSARTSVGIGQAMRRDIYHKVLAFSGQELSLFSTSSLITRSTNDVTQIQNLLVMLLRILFYAPVLAFGALYKVIHLNADMTWIIAAAVGLMLVLLAGVFSLAIPRFKKIQLLTDKLNMVTRESLTGMLVVRAFNNERYEEKKFQKVNEDFTGIMTSVGRIMITLMPLMMLILNGVTLFILWTGAHQIDQGSLQVGDMMAFIQYAMQIIMSFLMFAMISFLVPRASVSLKRIAEVLDQKIQVEDTPESRLSKALPKGKGDVVFDHVSFAYPGGEEDVLHDISFHAQPGTTTAIIGGTGSGKSTLIHLLLRYYDATNGQIRLNQTDIRAYPLQDLRNRFGFVPQKNLLFSGTIEENIRFGHDQATFEDVKKAAAIAQSQDFIDSQSEGYQEMVAQGGMNFSGGQKQRLSIARAVVREPEVFLFDDSFSALDFKTDAALRKSLAEELKDTTLLIVAQRVSTVAHADQILVLDEGRIVGAGTHEQLMQENALYQQIALSQGYPSEAVS